MIARAAMATTLILIEPSIARVSPPARDLDEVENPSIEDSVIRELKRSLRPKHR
jgi:hypothetical protein